MTILEEDREIYKSWNEYFYECEAFNQFKASYNQHGNVCGCPVYEAHAEEKILFADETLIHIFGCNNYMEFYKLVGGSFKNLVHPDDIERVEMEIADQIQTSEESGVHPADTASSGYQKYPARTVTTGIFITECVKLSGGQLSYSTDHNTGGGSEEAFR